MECHEPRALTRRRFRGAMDFDARHDPHREHDPHRAVVEPFHGAWGAERQCTMTDQSSHEFLSATPRTPGRTLSHGNQTPDDFLFGW